MLQAHKFVNIANKAISLERKVNTKASTTQNSSEPTNQWNEAFLQIQQCRATLHHASSPGVYFCMER